MMCSFVGFYVTFVALIQVHSQPFQEPSVKQTILQTTSGAYIKNVKPGEGRVPSTWMQTPEHAELFMEFLYEDYLIACG